MLTAKFQIATPAQFQRGRGGQLCPFEPATRAPRSKKLLNPYRLCLVGLSKSVTITEA